MLQRACGWLRWPPDAFWGATLAEVHSAITGYLESRGVAQAGSKAAMYDELLALGREAKREERWAARQATVH